MRDRIDRVPAGLDHQFVDREGAPLDEAADGEPAAAVVGREERPQQPFAPFDPDANLVGIDLQAGGRRPGDRLGHQPLLEGDLVDARHGADPPQHGRHRQGREYRVDAPPQPAAGLALP